MTPRLGYYVHHQGRGHLSRARAIVSHLRTPCTLLSSLRCEDLGWAGERIDRPMIDLPLDVVSSPRQRSGSTAVPLPSVLHHAPIGVPGLRERVARISRWFTTADPAAIVVDVSVEVALLARLSGVAPVVVRQHGDRRDAAHRAAYEGAAALLAPWPAALEDETASAELRDRTWYVGGFTRYDGRCLTRNAARDSLGLHPDRPTALVLQGAGGAAIPPARIIEAARHAPAWRWIVVGSTGSPAEAHRTIDWCGWVEDPFPLLRAADVVITHAGHNAVMEAAAAAAPLVVIPASRPFDEQEHKARRLAELGAAIVLSRWPAGARWPGLLERAREHDPAALVGLVDGGGARRAAARLDSLVEELAG